MLKTQTRLRRFSMIREKSTFCPIEKFPKKIKSMEKKQKITVNQKPSMKRIKICDKMLNIQFSLDGKQYFTEVWHSPVG